MDSEERRLRRRLLRCLRECGVIGSSNGQQANSYPEKEQIRSRHSAQRRELLEKSRRFLSAKTSTLLPFFASGHEIDPDRIVPRLQLVSRGTLESELFRFASLTWAVPVSEGYGRRMRFLVWDESIEKVMGLIALGDPVFNLRARDDYIGWDAKARAQRLVNVMDAFVLGSVPPYSMLLCGKLVACAVRTQEVASCFAARYGKSEGIISRVKKQPRLVMVTTTSALGRSSVYNRLRLGGMTYFKSVGYTSGYGHFHIPESVFNDVRSYLRSCGHAYAEGNRFGAGPNWKFRALRAAFELLGIGRDVLFHGVGREVFVCNMATNADDVMLGRRKRPKYDDLLGMTEVSELALERWVRPRASRMREYREWQREDLLERLSLD